MFRDEGTICYPTKRPPSLASSDGDSDNSGDEDGRDDRDGETATAAAVVTMATPPTPVAGLEVFSVERTMASLPTKTRIKT